MVEIGGREFTNEEIQIALRHADAIARGKPDPISTSQRKNFDFIVSHSPELKRQIQQGIRSRTVLQQREGQDPVRVSQRVEAERLGFETVGEFRERQSQAQSEAAKERVALFEAGVRRRPRSVEEFRQLEQQATDPAVTVEERRLAVAQIQQTTEVTQEPRTFTVQKVDPETGEVLAPVIREEVVEKERFGRTGLGDFIRDVGVGIGFRKPETELVFEDITGAIRPVTEEETKLFEQSRTEQLNQLSKDFQSKPLPERIKIKFEEGAGVVTGTLNVTGFLAGEQERGRIALEKSRFRVLSLPTIPTTQQIPALRTPDLVRIKRAEVIGSVGPFFIPVFGPAAFLTAGIEQRIFPKGLEQIKQRQEFLQQAGFTESQAKKAARLPSELQIAAGIVAVQASLARQPFVTRGRQIRTTELIKQRNIQTPQGIRTQFAIRTKTVLPITIERRGLVIFGDRFVKFQKVRFDTLTVIGKPLVKDGQIRGLVRGQREGAKMFKILEFRGKVDEIAGGDISKLAREQQQLLRNFGTRTTGETRFALGDVELKELGKVVDGKFTKFEDFRKLGTQTRTAVVGGKADPLRSIGLKQDDIATLMTDIPDKELFTFTEITGKRLGEGFPTLARSQDLVKLDVLSKLIPEESFGTGVQVIKPADIVKTPLSKTFGTGQIQQIVLPSEVPSVIPTTAAKLTPEIIQTTALKTSTITGGLATLQQPTLQFVLPAARTTDIAAFGVAGALRTQQAFTPTQVEAQKVFQIPTVATTPITSEVVKTITAVTPAIPIPTITTLVTPTVITTLPPTPAPLPTPQLRFTLPEEGFITPRLRPRRIRGRRVGGFPVFLRRFGVFKPIGVGRTQQEALQIGSQAAERTLATTFKVPTAKAVTIPKFTTKLTRQGPLFIEQRRFRLDAPSEIAELQFFRRKKKRKGGRK